MRQQRRRLIRSLRNLPKLIIVRVLSHSGLEELSLSAVPVLPVPQTATANNDLITALRPFQRNLWRKRATLVLLRLWLIALLYLLLANLLWIKLMPTLPLAARVVPTAACALLGVLLALAQRPTFAETARLLDYRFHLDDQLGAALEIDQQQQHMPPIEARLVARACVLVQNVAHKPWTTSRRSAEGKVVLLVLVAAIASLFFTPSLSSPIRSAVLAPAPHTIPSLSSGGSSLLQHDTTAPPVSRTLPSSTGAVAANTQSFASSLQMHAGPQVVGGIGANGAAGGPQPLQATLGGSQQGAAAGSTPPDVGPSGATTNSKAQGGHRGGAAASAPNGTSSKGGQGTGGQGHGLQPQQGNQNNSQSTNNAANQGQGTTANKGLPNDANQGPNQPTSGANQANPFGQDPQNRGANTRGTRNGAGTGKGNAGQPGRNTRTSNRPGQSTAKQNGSKPSQGTNGPDDLLRRHGQNQSTATQQPAPKLRPGQAGPARGSQIDLSGRPELSTTLAGPRLVRVLPLGAGQGPGLGNPTTVGSGSVYGYMPEDDPNLAPDEQALVRSYFSYQAGQ